MARVLTNLETGQLTVSGQKRGHQILRLPNSILPTT